MGLLGLIREHKSALPAVLGAAGVLVLLISIALDALISWQVQLAIHRTAEVRAQDWVTNFFRTTPTARQMVEKGEITQVEFERLKSSFPLVGIIRFEMFNADGMRTVLADNGTLMLSDEFNAEALAVFKSGHPTVLIHEHDHTVHHHPTPYLKTYMEVYLPAVLPNGEKIGTVEVYVDVTQFEETLEQIFQNISRFLILGTFVSIMIPFAAYIQTTRQVIRKDKRLLELKRYDQLTGVLNRDSVSKYLNDHFKGSVDTGNLGILFVDVDYFKQVNDRYGHAQGDMVLKKIGAILSSSTRSVKGVVGRFGGDEFVVLVPDISQADFRKLHAQIVELTRKPQRDEGNNSQFSLSIGAYLTALGDTENVALHRADLALYAAKRRGRGRVIEYTTDLEGLFETAEKNQPA